MNINTDHLIRCIETLEKSLDFFNSTEKGSVEYEIYRNSLVKGFELTLEHAGKLLKKRIALYFAYNKAVDSLNYKDIFRYAHKHSLISEEELNRWFKYRDNRNNTAHDYGVGFAEETLCLVEMFLSDVKRLEKVIRSE